MIDIDAVLILDEFTPEDLRRYRHMLDTLPEREKICGFVSGREELLYKSACFILTGGVITCEA